MLNLLKLTKLFVFSFVVFSFLISLFSSKYYEYYEESDIAMYNLEIMHGLHEVEGKNLCEKFKKPLWGMSIYYQLYPLSFLTMKISALFLLLTFIVSFIKKGILSERKDKFAFVFLIVIFLWSNWMISGIAMGFYPSFYNCAKIIS